MSTKKKTLDRNSTELHVNIADLHSPFQDKYAVELVLRVLELIQPDYLNVLGDLVDLSAISSFPYNPEKAEKKLQGELDDAHGMLSDFKEAAGKKVKMVVEDGNHEFRLEKFLTKNWAISSLRALKMERLLELKKIGVSRHVPYSEDFWEYSPSGIAEHWIVPKKLVAIHGYYARKVPGSAIRSTMDDYGGGVSVIQGHGHKSCVVIKPTRWGPIMGVEQGCLCKRLPGYNKAPVSTWSQSFTIVQTLKGHDSFHIDLIPILADGKDYKCFAMGRRIGRKGYLD